MESIAEILKKHKMWLDDEEEGARADLSGAYLRDANLGGANISGAEGVPPISCPECGAFIGFKKARRVDNDEYCIVKIQILESSKRSSATTRKCRCDNAVVIDIEDVNGNNIGVDAKSIYDNSFKYIKGENIKADNFCEDRWAECAGGIHFFLTRKEADDYNF